MNLLCFTVTRVSRIWEFHELMPEDFKPSEPNPQVCSLCHCCITQIIGDISLNWKDLYVHCYFCKHRHWKWIMFYSYGPWGANIPAAHPGTPGGHCWSPAGTAAAPHRAHGGSSAAGRLCWNSPWAPLASISVANNRIIRRADTRRGLSVSSRPALCFGKGCPVLAKQQSNPDPTADGAEA